MELVDFYIRTSEGENDGKPQNYPTRNLTHLCFSRNGTLGIPRYLYLKSGGVDLLAHFGHLGL